MVAYFPKDIQDKGEVMQRVKLLRKCKYYQDLLHSLLHLVIMGMITVQWGDAIGKNIGYVFCCLVLFAFLLECAVNFALVVREVGRRTEKMKGECHGRQ